jgi:cytochrome c-type biogenesis protein CcmE
MTKGALIGATVALVAMGGVVAAFMSSASPYVTVAQAKELRRPRMHLAGDIVPGTLEVDVKNREVRFGVKDAEGGQIRVVHRGEVPSNVNSATKVVAIGEIKGGDFVSDQLLLKCPSRYESEAK